MSDKRSRFEKRTFQLLEDFDAAARHWGYIQDQGTGSSVTSGEELYKLEKAALLKRINQLHAYKRRVDRLEEELAAAQGAIAYMTADATARSG